MGQHSKSEPKKEINLPKINLSVPNIPNIKIDDNVKNAASNKGITAGRLAAAAVIVAVTKFLDLPAFVNYVLLFVALACAGFGVLMKLIDDIAENKYFTINVSLALVCVVSIVMGYFTDCVLMLIIYEVGQLALKLFTDKSKESAEGLLDVLDEADVEKVKKIVADGDAQLPAFEEEVRSAADLMLKIAGVIAIIFAVVVPILTNYTFADCLHRAMMVLVITSPLSVIAAIPSVGVNAVCYAASKGFIFKKAETFLLATQTKSVIVDKGGILTDGAPKLVSLDPEIIDQFTYLTFAAHAVYYSEQSMFKAITDSYEEEYKTELIDNFSDLPGSGVSLTVGGKQVVLGVAELFAGTRINFKAPVKGVKHLYMTVGGRYVGCIGISTGVRGETSTLVEDLKEEGPEFFVLLSEDGEESNDVFSDYADFNKIYNGLNTEGKINVVHELVANNPDIAAFVYSSGVEGHSDADIDIRVSKKGKFADILVDPNAVGKLPELFKLSARVKELLGANATAAFAVKGILIFLALTGNCTLWFAMLIDSVAALATVLNSSRVGSESVLKSIQNRKAK